MAQEYETIVAAFIQELPVLGATFRAAAEIPPAHKSFARAYAECHDDPETIALFKSLGSKLYNFVNSTQL